MQSSENTIIASMTGVTYYKLNCKLKQFLFLNSVISCQLKAEGLKQKANTAIAFGFQL
jgi:hypothetical protein